MSHPQNERRTSARLVDSIKFKLGFDGYDYSSQTLNISSSGLLCTLKTEIPVMSKIKMALVLPSRLTDQRSSQIEVTGVVVRNEREDNMIHTAIFFLEMSSSHRRKLDAYIANRMEPDA